MAQSEHEHGRPFAIWAAGGIFLAMAFYVIALCVQGRTAEVVEENGVLELFQLIISSISAMIFLTAAWRSGPSALKTCATLLGLFAIAVVLRESDFAFLEHSAGLGWKPSLEINDVAFIALAAAALTAVGRAWRQIPAMIALAFNPISWPLYLTVALFAVGMGSDMLHNDTLKVHLIEEVSETFGHIALFIGALRHERFLAEENDAKIATAS